jgi:hypothetical protein
MTTRKTVAITAAFLLFVLNTVSAQDEWDALGGDEEEESDEESEDDESEDDERPPEPESYPDQVRDEEGFVGPDTDEAEEGETSGEEAPLRVSAPKEDKPISVGLLVGYGIGFEQDIANEFGLGFGCRGGYTFDMGIYAGAKFVYYLGGESDTRSVNIVSIGVEGGYELELEPFVFVPSLELGIGLWDKADSAGIDVGSSTNFYFAPGLSILYPFDMFFIGLDVSIPIVFKDPTVEGLSLMATGGVLF